MKPEAYPGRLQRIVELMDCPQAVLDLGAGAAALRTLLPPGCTYHPVDQVAYTPDFTVCDFNKGELPPCAAYDYVVCSGILEYLDDVPAFLANLHRCPAIVLVSYASAGQRRRPAHWRNTYTKIKMEALFTAAGYDITAARQWRTQDIWRLTPNER